MDARCDLGWRNRSGDAAIVAAARKRGHCCKACYILYEYLNHVRNTKEMIFKRCPNSGARKGQVGAVKWLLHPAVDAVDFQRAWNAASKLSKPDDEHDSPDQPSHQESEIDFRV